MKEQNIEHNSQQILSLDSYSEQIIQQYSEKLIKSPLLKPFVSMHSDYLHILYCKMTNKVRARSEFQEGDIVLEVRGGVATWENVRRWRIGGELLWLDKSKGIVLKPNELASVFLMNRQQIGNCRLTNHFNSKIFITAARNIEQGEELVLEASSYNKMKCEVI